MHRCCRAFCCCPPGKLRRGGGGGGAAAQRVQPYDPIARFVVRARGEVQELSRHELEGEAAPRRRPGRGQRAVPLHALRMARGMVHRGQLGHAEQPVGEKARA